MKPISDKNWIVGASVIAGIILVMAPCRASGQTGPAESPSNIECLEHLEVPDYPPLVRQANIQVTQTVKVLLSDRATAQNIESSLKGTPINVEGLFKEGAEKALKSSRYSKTCVVKTVTLVFHYEIRDDPKRSSLFAFGPPNQFWIRAEPFYVEPEISVK